MTLLVQFWIPAVQWNLIKHWLSDILSTKYLSNTLRVDSHTLQDFAARSLHQRACTNPPNEWLKLFLSHLVSVWNGQKLKEQKKRRQKQTEMDRKITEIYRKGQKRRETHRDRQKPTESNRNGQNRSKLDRNRQKHTETDRNGQKLRETDRNRQKRK